MTVNTARVRPATGPEVRVIGVGGAGCSALPGLVEDLPGTSRFLGIDSGSGTNGLGACVDVVQIGDGFGCGGDPGVAEGLFVGSAVAVSRFVNGADIVVVVAGLGRGTGSAVAPLVAQASRSAGALTLSAASVPFEFEGRFRGQTAATALKKLRESSDLVFVTGNGGLTGQVRSDINSPLCEAFAETGRKITDTVRAVVAVMEASGAGFSKLRASLRGSGRGSGDSTVVSGSAEGLHAGAEAVALAISGTPSGFPVTGRGFPDLSRAKNVVVHIAGGIGLSPGQVAEAVASVRAKTDRFADIHVSTVREVAMGRKLRVTLVIAGGNSAQVPVFGSKQDNAWGISAGVQPTPAFDLQETVALSIFDRPLAVRRRGPVLLPSG